MGTPERQIENWARTSLNETAVAVYGGSIELVRQITETGHVPSYPSSKILPYMHDVKEDNKHLYFFLPFLDEEGMYLFRRISKLPAFRRNSNNYVRQLLEDWRSPELALGAARIYASRNAVSDYMLKETKVEAVTQTELVAAAELLLPPSETSMYREKIKTYYPEDFVMGREVLKRKGMDEKSIEELLRPLLEREQNPEDSMVVDRLMPQLDPHSIRKFLEVGFSRLGVLIYFNKAILSEKIFPGYEDEAEIIIVTQAPLSASCISGIDICSDADRKALGI